MGTRQAWRPVVGRPSTELSGDGLEGEAYVALVSLNWFGLV